MQTFRNNSILSLKPGFYIGIAVILLLLPIKWMIAWTIAVALHELSHCISLLFLNIKIHRITLGLSGACIETASMPAWKEIISALAGPFGGLMLLFFAKWFPTVAVCAFLQSIYNLLPVYPLDGGRVVRLIIPDTVSKIIETGILVLLSTLGFLSTFYLKLGPIPLIGSILFLFKNTLQSRQTESTMVSTRKLRGRFHERAAAKDSPNGAKACAIHRRRI